MRDFRLRRGANGVVALLGCYTAFIVTDVSGQLIDPLKMGPLGCQETSVTINAV